MPGIKLVKDISFAGKRVFVRIDVDVPVSKKEGGGQDDYKVVDEARIKAALPTLRFILDSKPKQVILGGHLGDEQLSTLTMAPLISAMLGERVKWCGQKAWISDEVGARVGLMENLRINPGEKENDNSLAARWSEKVQVYVNEAFAVSHREHTSVVALPVAMKAQGKEVAMGFRVDQELKSINEVWNKSGKKILVIGGAKAGDKALLAEQLESKFNAVLKGGLLPGVKLRPDGLDIGDTVITEYLQKLNEAGVIVVAGPLGKYEVTSSEKGTKEVYSGVASSAAYKVAGGGDTEAAIAKFGLGSKFDWISVGGGAMLELLAKGKLVGIEALQELVV